MNAVHAFLNWVRREPAEDQISSLCLKFYLAFMAYAAIMTGLTSLFPRPTPWIQFPVHTGPEPTIEPLIGYEWLVWTVVLFVKLFPELLLEEVIFRTFPLGVAAWRKLPDWWYLVLVPVATFFFVFCGHMSYAYPFLFQGVLGLGLSVAYLKLGGYQGKWFTATLLVTCIHTAYDVSWMVYNDPQWRQ